LRNINIFYNMQKYLASFNSNYDNVKLYVLLYPYKSYIDKYELGCTNINICTNDNIYNEDIHHHIKKFFSYKNIKVFSKRKQ